MFCIIYCTLAFRTEPPPHPALVVSAHWSKLIKTGQNWSKLVKTGQCRSVLVNTGQYWPYWSILEKAGTLGNTGQNGSTLVNPGRTRCFGAGGSEFEARGGRLPSPTRIARPCPDRPERGPPACARPPFYPLLFISSL